MNHKILVTGNSKGLGQTISVELIKDGYNVINASRKVGIDLMTDIGINLLLSQCNDVGCVVHNLGGTLGGQDFMYNIKYWQDVWMYNIGIAIQLNNWLIPRMLHKGQGKLIFISSDCVETLKAAPAYVCAKAYLEKYVEILKKEIGNKIPIYMITPTKITNKIDSLSYAKQVIELVRL